jgi:ribosome maturation factor RimP
MARQAIAERVKELVAPIIASEDFELVDVEFKHEGRVHYLRIFIDKPGGVTIDDCQHISRECEAVLDVENIIRSQYVLEVSSPGLDRPLRSKDDFQQFVHRLAKIKTFRPLQGRTKFLGHIEGIREDPATADTVVTIRTPEGQVFQIPYKMIASARLEVEF